LEEFAMERMEYDPEGGDYLPVTEHETGSTMMVVGVVMLLAGLGWGLFVGWDIRGGNTMMRFIFGIDIFIAVLLIAWGFVKKTRKTA
jgi:hypothetical protein